MRFLRLFAAFAALLWTTDATNNGLTDVVEWDQYSSIVNGSRIFVFSAEIHYQRIPVPEMWLDIFQKIKANGFNIVSLYFFWSYHSPNKDTYDFETTGKNLQRLFDYAKKTGLYVIARAGPYINAETSAGGYALWGGDGSAGKLRTSDEAHYQYWLPWVQQVGKIIAANQITNGGPVIINQVENELQETVYSSTNTVVLYMEQLKKAFLDAGVVIPLSHNEKGQRAVSWSTDYKNVGGAINMYGLDSYPGGLSCTNLDSGFNLVRNYYQWFSNYSYTQPNYFPEFEGGWFSAWGGAKFYDDCLAEHDPAFADVYYKNNLGQRTTLLSIYMTYGGTNWGHSAAPVVYTSYDYSAPLRETRQIQDKLYQTKLIGLFTRVSKDLLKTYMVGNGTGWSVDSSAIWTWQLANPDTGSNFYILQHAKSSSRDSDTFSVSLTTSKGNISVPNVNLQGRQSKLLVTDYAFGSHTLLYTSTNVLTYGIFDVDVLAFYLNVGQVGQFAFKGGKTLTYTTYGNSNLTSTVADGTQTFVYTQGKGQTTVKFSNGLVLYLFDQFSAWHFWAPATTTNPTIEPNEQIFVIGPYLVRDAYVSHGVVHVSGDSNATSTIEVYTGNPAIQTIDWNGIRLVATKTSWGSVTAKIPGTETRSVALPLFTNWKSGNCLPEIDPAYDDSKWAVCNKTTTLNPVPPLTKPVLYASDYGFYSGATIYRGYFDGKNATGANITASGGLAFGWSAWLNGALLGSESGTSLATTTTKTFTFSNSSLKATNNVITVLVDYHGHDETSTAYGVENPRGLLGASLLGSGTFKTWKITGNGVGPSNLDPARGPMNEGGLYCERLGWHLPSYPPSSLPSRTSPFVGLSTSGVQFYQTTFHLNIDSDLDAPLGIEFSAPAGTVARVMFWVNGYQYGKYVPHIGPQTRFPVPPGVINNRGLNTLGVSVWAMGDEGARLEGVKLVNYGLYQTGFKFNQDWSALQPGWVQGQRDRFA